MTVHVQFVATSNFVHDKELDWSNDIDGKEVHVLGFKCTHDCMVLDDEGAYCPDCPVGQGLTPEDVDQAYAAREPGEMDDEG